MIPPSAPTQVSGQALVQGQAIQLPSPTSVPVVLVKKENPESDEKSEQVTKVDSSLNEEDKSSSVLDKIEGNPVLGFFPTEGYPHLWDMFL